jgi:uracil-DNA glycosylase
VRFIADSDRNPFGMTPPCDRYVPGYGATDAHFHVVGDHPGVHGGLSTGIPFTDRPWSAAFFDALARAEFVRDVDLDSGRLVPGRTFFSYLHMCAAEDTPSEADYDRMEPFFDAELRAITAHVLLPVGPRATEHVLRTFTAEDVADGIDMDARHGTRIQGAGWLVVPIVDPAEWGADGADRLAERLLALQESDYRQLSDLGRLADSDGSYFVR